MKTSSVFRARMREISSRVPIDWDRSLEKAADELLLLLRQFDVGKDAADAALTLAAWLNIRPPFELHHFEQLRAMTLASEFFDAWGAYDLVHELLTPTARRLLKLPWDKVTLPAQRRQVRQQLLLLIAWGCNQIQQGFVDEVPAVVNVVTRALRDCLIAPDYPCLGTQYHLFHLTGMMSREQGYFERASSAFARALHFAKARRDHQWRRYQDDPDRRKTETAYFKVCEFRSLALMAELDFMRGHFARADALFAAAEVIGGSRGFPRWHRVAKLYRAGCDILTADLNSPEINFHLESAAQRLRALDPELKRTGAGLAYRALGRSFQLLAKLRPAQIVEIRRTNRLSPLTAGGVTPLGQDPFGKELKLTHHLISKSLHSMDDTRTGEATRGPLERLVQRIAVEALVRRGHPFAEKHLNALIRPDDRMRIFTSELRLLRVEHMILMGEKHRAYDDLYVLSSRETTLTRRQSHWLQLLKLRDFHASEDGLRLIEPADLIDDGYLGALYRSIPPTLEQDKLPFLWEVPVPNLHIDTNFDVLVKLILQKAVERARDSPEKQLPYMYRGTGFLRKHFNKYDEPWAAEGIKMLPKADGRRTKASTRRSAAGEARRKNKTHE